MNSIDSTRDAVFRQVEQAIADGSLIALVLSDPDVRDASVPRKQTLRPVTVRGDLRYQFASRVGKQEIHENLAEQPALERVFRAFGAPYRHLYLYTTQADVIARHRGASVQQTVRPPSRVQRVVEHNRRKQYIIPEGVPCSFLHALGVMNAEGAVLGNKQHKFRQINRYLELVNDVYPSLPAEGTLRVADFGCGLSYLTFAVHHLLTAVHHRDVDVVGIDRNPELVARCNKTAAGLGAQGLSFVAGEIARQGSAAMAGPLDLAISLHACDVATDDALAFAVKRGARVILAAPCCQHELAGKLDDESLALITRHGILKERLAALATDALRAAALEAAGYRTQVLEFIETEHTPKNVLIRAVAREGAFPDEQWHRRYEQFRLRLGATAIASDGILEAVKCRDGNGLAADS